MLRQPVPCCGWAATAMGRQWIAGRWCCLGALLFPQIESLQLGVVAQFGGATRQKHASPGSVYRAAGWAGPIRARAIASICCFSRFTLIGPSALAQTNRLGSIHGQKKELRDLVRRPPFTARLTATDSALPPRESAMGCSRYGPLATVTPDPQLYCEACFVVSDHGCIRPMMYARVLIHGAMDVTSPPGFL